jgi:hypothetical protein
MWSRMGHDGSMTRVSAGTEMPDPDAMRGLHDEAEVAAIVMLQWLVDQGRLDAMSAIISLAMSQTVRFKPTALLTMSRRSRS